MPVYTYRRADGSTFDIRQKFIDRPLETCPTTGQAVARVIQPAGIIFKGSGFYVNDNNKASNPASPAKTGADASTNGETQTGGENKTSEPAKTKADSSAAAQPTPPPQ